MITNKIEAELAPADRGFIGGISQPIRTLESVIAEIAPTNIPVLLIGETGTGKEMFAQRIHQLSRLNGAPLVKISCASINLATFSTVTAALGLNAEGNGGGDKPKSAAGTFFFDEISELDAACQRNLLYALPDGDSESRRGVMAARVISTTSGNLDDELRAGRFRSELYYRINGVCLRLPALRERKEDIPLLVEFFLTKHAQLFERPRPSLSPRTLRVFLDHSWPGNIRELENVVKKIVALGDEELSTAGFGVAPAETRDREIPAGRGYSLKAASRAASQQAERDLIMKALARTRWNRRRAAQELQISYKSLLYKLKRIGFEDAGTN